MSSFESILQSSIERTEPFVRSIEETIDLVAGAPDMLVGLNPILKNMAIFKMEENVERIHEQIETARQICQNAIVSFDEHLHTARTQLNNAEFSDVLSRTIGRHYEIIQRLDRCCERLDVQMQRALTA